MGGILTREGEGKRPTSMEDGRGGERGLKGIERESPPAKVKETRTEQCPYWRRRRRRRLRSDHRDAELVRW